jgi:hypothetical protein
MDEQKDIQPPPPPPDRSPAAKDAAIAALWEGLKEAKQVVHFDTVYNMLRYEPAFDAHDPDERIYIMQHWPGRPEQETQTSEEDLKTKK